VGHAAAIQSVIIKPESMYSGSMDSTMRIWNIESGEAVRTFNSNFRFDSNNVSGFYVVYDVLLSEDLLIACALSSIEAFSLTSGQKTIFLEGLSYQSTL
jgi:WD40 repeat protein